LEALEALGRIAYDVVLMDCQMPEMDGYQATSAIRQQEKNGGHIPIIAMTANALPGDREKCLKAGMDDYMAKPVTSEKLEEMLSQWCLPQKAPTNGKIKLASGIKDARLLKELMRLFARQTPGMLSTMREAVAKKNADALAVAAHTLKGSSSNFGVEKIPSLCRRIEEQARSGKMNGLEGLIDELEEEFQKMCQAFKGNRPIDGVGTKS
jgi:CheY-like chemotaxis protein